MGDFEIEKGILRRYRGRDAVVTVPAAVRRAMEEAGDQPAIIAILLDWLNRYGDIPGQREKEEKQQLKTLL